MTPEEKELVEPGENLYLQYPFVKGTGKYNKKMYLDTNFRVVFKEWDRGNGRAICKVPLKGTLYDDHEGLVTIPHKQLCREVAFVIKKL